MNKLLTSLTLISALFVMPLMAREMPNFPFLTANGKAEVEVAPDIAEIRFSLLSFNKNSDIALRELNKVSYDLSKFLLKSGIDETDITTHAISKQSKRSNDRKSYQELEVLGYEVTQRFIVKIKQIDKFESIMNKLLVTNLVEAIQTEFDVSNREELETSLISEAGAKAKQKAKMLAAGVGVSIDSVFAVHDENERGFQPRYRFSSEVMAMKMGAPGRASVFVPHTIKLEKVLSVIYKIDN